MEKVYKDEECVTCGVIFKVTELYDTKRREDKAIFYCPNGHGMNYSKSTADQLRETLSEKNTKIFELESQIRKLTTKPKRKKK